jgi:hypothetical protein
MKPWRARGEDVAFDHSLIPFFVVSLQTNSMKTVYNDTNLRHPSPPIIPFNFFVNPIFPFPSGNREARFGIGYKLGRMALTIFLADQTANQPAYLLLHKSNKSKRVPQTSKQINVNPDST